MGRNCQITPLALVSIFLCFFFIHLEARSSSGADTQKGKQVFDSICSACHTIGGGTKVGPDLKDITNKRPTPWLTDFISDPAKMIKSGDPVANRLLKEFHGVQMPSLGLSGEKVSDVLAYLQSTREMAKAQAPAPSAQPPLPSVQPSAPPAGVPTPAPGPAAATLPAGSAEKGKQLFSGEVAFQKGGPPCLSCHDVASLPFPGGGTLGPDLTGAFARFGAEKMNSILASPPFPTMKPIYDQRPLTAQEPQDLEAFLQKEAGIQSLVGRGVQIGLAAIGGLIILVILAWIIRQNRVVTAPKEPLKSARRD
jgi:cytochrome c2